MTYFHVNILKILRPLPLTSVDNYDHCHQFHNKAGHSTSPGGHCFPDSKVHGANMGPICGRQDLGGPHVGPMNFAIWVVANFSLNFPCKMTFSVFQWPRLFVARKLLSWCPFIFVKSLLFICRSCIHRGYPAKRALSAMRKHGGWGPFGKIPSTCAWSSNELQWLDLKMEAQDSLSKKWLPWRHVLLLVGLPPVFDDTNGMVS